MPHTSRLQQLALSGALVLLGSCNLITGDTNCILPVYPALEVTVRDAATGSPLDTLAIVIARDGSFADTARVGEPGTWLPPGVVHVGGNRAGTYTVTASRPGYVSWSRAGVQVVRGSCKLLDTQELDARLQPAP